MGQSNPGLDRQLVQIVPLFDESPGASPSYMKRLAALLSSRGRMSSAERGGMDAQNQIHNPTGALAHPAAYTGRGFDFDSFWGTRPHWDPRLPGTHTPLRRTLPAFTLKHGGTYFGATKALLGETCSKPGRQHVKHWLTGGLGYVFTHRRSVYNGYARITNGFDLPPLGLWTSACAHCGGS